jgi:hypothetical protein
MTMQGLKDRTLMIVGAVAAAIIVAFLIWYSYVKA